MFSKSTSLFIFILCLATFLSHLQAEQTPKIKAVVFDFGGVIAKTDRNEVAHFIAQTLNISTDQVIELIAQLKVRALEGKNERGFWLDYANSKGIKLPDNWLEQLNEVRFHALKIIPGMVDLVKNLQKQGYQTALLSNVKESKAQIKRHLGLYELFHPALFSYEIGVSKPNLEVYHILLERLKMNPEQVLFIDNKPLNVEAAKSLDIDAVLFVNTNQLTEDLKQRGINISFPTESRPSINK